MRMAVMGRLVGIFPARKHMVKGFRKIFRLSESPGADPEEKIFI